MAKSDAAYKKIYPGIVAVKKQSPEVFYKKKY